MGLEIRLEILLLKKVLKSLGSESVAYIFSSWQDTMTLFLKYMSACNIRETIKT